MWRRSPLRAATQRCWVWCSAATTSPGTRSKTPATSCSCPCTATGPESAAWSTCSPVRPSTRAAARPVCLWCLLPPHARRRLPRPVHGPHHQSPPSQILPLHLIPRVLRPWRKKMTTIIATTATSSHRPGMEVKTASMVTTKGKVKVRKMRVKVKGKATTRRACWLACRRWRELVAGAGPTGDCCLPDARWDPSPRSQAAEPSRTPKPSPQTLGWWQVECPR
mmetsp:Transcript_40979/g.70925  ORF Transcript_40979/g.70925 Transcript_40979/m.70925 type:complete len:222 (+) Transcript_40979:455-1120(+)